MGERVRGGTEMGISYGDKGGGRQLGTRSKINGGHIWEYLETSARENSGYSTGVTITEASTTGEYGY